MSRVELQTLAPPDAGQQASQPGTRFVAARRASDSPATPPSLRFLSGYLVTMRPYLLFISGISGIAGLSLAPDIAAGSALALSTVFFLSYGFGQALTDCFQLDTDSLSAPYRPLVRGEIRRGDVMLVSLIGLTACGLVVALHHRLNVPLAALSVGGLATYTHFKRRWWAGPFYNAWIMAVLALIGYVSGLGAAEGPLRGSPALVLTLLCVFFGYANFVLAGYYKDISADRATGYRTLPVAFGRRVSALVSDLFALLSLAGCGGAVYVTLAGAHPAASDVIPLALLAGGALTTVVAQARLHAVRDDGDAHRAITPLLRSYVLLLAAIAAAQKPAWAPALLLFYGWFLFTLKRRPMREQI